MSGGNGSALALAAWLRALDDDALARLLRDRDVRPSGVRDYFDLAEALLEPASLQPALEVLDRPTLAMLAVAGELRATRNAPTATELATTLGTSAAELAPRLARAEGLGLLSNDGRDIVPWDAVAAQLHSWPSLGLPGARELVTVPVPPALEPVSPAGPGTLDGGAAERAFATVTGVSEIVAELHAAPARRLSRGGVALPDARRIAQLADIPVDQVQLFLEMAQLAGLLIAAPRQWEASDTVDEWLSLPRVERWSGLAAGWIDRLIPELRALLHERSRTVWGDGLSDYLRWLYPAGHERIGELAERARSEAELLGILSSSTPTTVGTALLAEGPAAAAERLAALFPTEIDQLYLQNDLTVIAPGPLRPDVDRELRGFADPQTRGPASSYRITAAGITRALVAGQSPDDILTFLDRVSLGPVPQPLDYLVRDTAARFDTLRVAGLPLGSGRARSSLSSDDEELLAQLLVDPRLASLQLEAAGDNRLHSRLERDVAYWSLVDARYPAVAEDADGEIVDLTRPRPTRVDDEPGTDAARLLVERLRGAGEQASTASDQDWIARQLELAIKNRIAVTVRVRMPDDSEAELLLEPAAIAGGRLRARDRRRDLERTLPLSRITAVAPAE